MFLNYQGKTLPGLALVVAAFFSQSDYAQAQTECKLNASPPTLSSGKSSVLTASCVPTATSYEWAGGTCSNTNGATCTVNPSVTTSYSVIGTSGASTSPLAQTTVFAEWLNDGIYQWDSNYYLSLHRIAGDIAIATIYWAYPSSTVVVGSRPIPDTDTFDLLSGKIAASKVTVTGARFFRACKASYDLDLRSATSISVTLTTVSNSPEATAAGVDCLARYGPVGVSKVIPVIKF